VINVLNESKKLKTTAEVTLNILNVFNHRCLRTILGIWWRDHTTNEEVLNDIKSPGYCNKEKMKICFTHPAPPATTAGINGLVMDPIKREEE